MILPALDQRLATAFALFPHCSLGADIGCDHGRLSLHLLAENRCEKMILTDISPKALQKGKALIEHYHYENSAFFYQGDGLAPLTQPVEAISILGMGGNTICQILSKGATKLQGGSLILSAHTQGEEIRRLLPLLGYKIEKEKVAYAAGRHYVLLKALPGNVAYSEKEILLGPKLLENPSKEVQAYWQWQHRVFIKALKGQQKSQNPVSADFVTYVRYLEEEIR